MTSACREWANVRMICSASNTKVFCLLEILARLHWCQAQTDFRLWKSLNVPSSLWFRASLRIRYSRAGGNDGIRYKSTF